METLRWAVSFVCMPVFYVIDWITVDDHEYDQLIAAQKQRLIDQHEGE